MHRIENIFFLITVLHITQSVSEQCEVVKFVKENNIEKKCCVTNVSDLEIDKSAEENISIFKWNDISYICYGNEATTQTDEKSIDIEFNKENDVNKSGKKLKRKPPSIVPYYFGDSSKKCPDNQVPDFNGKCTDAF
ncbi:hypothetical protein HHI36_016324 [Cryptolaemus montrouzieri]|uniref:Uncharacterized protein n=1 Tax=Cryptolaemus montrouzieri TaxID=559131 RepID=A0ABD2NKA3_9CUCU